MIRCELGPEPSRFDADVRQPGRRWLDRNPHVRQPRPLWRAVVRELAAAFHERCAYLAIRILDGQVDHFIPCSEDRDLAYEWTNYRYCDPSINSRKSRTRSGELLDPCSIDDAWFEVLLPSLQVSVTERCPPALRARAESASAPSGCGSTRASGSGARRSWNSSITKIRCSPGRSASATLHRRRSALERCFGRA